MLCRAIKTGVRPTGLIQHPTIPASTISRLTSVRFAHDKPPLMQRIQHEVKHYVNGTKLLGYEMKTSCKLLVKFMQGYELSRRERNQLKRTTSDVFRLVPFSAFIIIPFAELLLPIALKLFPNLLPSTYESSSDRKKKRNKLIEVRHRTSQFLHETLEESTLINYNAIENTEKRKMFLAFFEKIYKARNESAGPVEFTYEEIARLSRMFKNDTVLDNLSREQLSAMCKFLSLRPLGTDNMLRYQIRSQLRNIMDDDKIIDYEGIKTLSQEEIYQACVSRGMKAYGVEIQDLKDNLQVWLDLRLRAKIPSVLMVLSSTFTFGGLPKCDEKIDDPHLMKFHSVPGPETSSNATTRSANYDRLLNWYYNGILKVLGSIPDPVYNVAKLDVSESQSDREPAKDDAADDIKPKAVEVETKQDETVSDDNEFKLSVLKEQEELIKREEEEAKKRSVKNARIEDDITLDEDDKPNKK